MLALGYALHHEQYLREKEQGRIGGWGLGFCGVCDTKTNQRKGECPR